MGRAVVVIFKVGDAGLPLVKLTEAGEKTHVAPVGTPCEQLNEMLVPKLPIGVKSTTKGAVSPAAGTLLLRGLTVILKSVAVKGIEKVLLRFVLLLEDAVAEA